MSGTKQLEHGSAGAAAAHGAGGGPLKWVAGHRALVAIVGGVVMVAVPVASFLLSGPAAEEPQPVTLELAVAALDRGDLDVAADMAQTLRDREDLADEEQGGPAYLLGVVAAQQSDAVFDEARTRLSLLAARHLGDARDLGFPPERQAHGLLMLGQSLHRTGQFEECRLALEEALKVNPASTTEICRLLAEACLNTDPPQLEPALEYNKKYLADVSLPAEDRWKSLLVQAEIELRQRDLPACRASLGQIPPNAAEYFEAALVEARMLMHEAVELGKQGSGDGEREQAVALKFEAAREAIRRATSTSAAKGRLASQAAYLSALCTERAGKLTAAIDEYGRTVAAHEATPESFAAAIRQAQLLSQLGRDQEATTAWRKAMASFVDPVGYRNPWLALEELRNGSQEMYDRYLTAGQFERAMELVEGFSPLYLRTRQVLLSAQTQRTWARELAERAERSPILERESLLTQSRVRFQQAGREFSRLAELRFTEREYPDDLWNAGECLASGQDYVGAAAVLSTYLNHEPNRRRAQALMLLGESLLVQGKLDESVATLQEALEFDSKDAAVYRCRILSSKAHLERGEAAAAEQLLQDNLQSSSLTPASVEWRQSLFDLGLLLHLEGRYAEAAPRLLEAVSRYPTAPQSLECRYLIADCHRQLAKAVQAQLESAVVDSGRNAQAKELNRLLEGAIEQCDRAVAMLQPRQEPGGRSALTPAEEVILRNCHFMKGSALFEMGRFEDAIRAYSTATNRYQQEPQVLDAYVQIADCYRRLNRPLEAKATIAQAKVVLGRMPSEVSFGEVTNFSRQEWTRHLEWLESL